MPPEDEAAQQPTEDTAADEAASQDETPAESTEDSQPATDWEKRYNDLRPEFDRTNQRASQLEEFIDALQNPETQAEALERLNLQLETDEEDTDEDPYEDPDERFERLEGYLAEREQQEELNRLQEAELDYIEDALDTLESDENIELSEDEVEAIVQLADARRDERGAPDIKGAYEALMNVSKAQRERYVESKKAERVEKGQAGTEDIDLSSDEARAKAMANIMEAEASNLS